MLKSTIKKKNYVLKNRKEKYINRKENERKFSISIDLGEENIDLPNRYKRGKKTRQENLYARCYLWLTIFLKKVVINLS